MKRPKCTSYGGREWRDGEGREEGGGGGGSDTLRGAWASHLRSQTPGGENVRDGGGEEGHRCVGLQEVDTRNEKRFVACDSERNRIGTIDAALHVKSDVEGLSVREWRRRMCGATACTRILNSPLCSNQ